MSIINYNTLKHALQARASVERARASCRFFKMGKGQYGEGDVFIGVSVPDIRDIARIHAQASMDDVSRLLGSPVHEQRLLALVIMVNKYRRANEREKSQLVNFYLKFRSRVNNWDLVDGSAPYLLGEHSLQKVNTKSMDRLLGSKRHWDRRIAVLATFPFTKSGRTELIFGYAEKLLNDEEDLMHKAVGWMLREAGKRDEKRLMDFIKKYGTRMPRAMLRYSIEKFSPSERKRILKWTKVQA